MIDAALLRLIGVGVLVVAILAGYAAWTKHERDIGAAGERAKWVAAQAAQAAADKQASDALAEQATLLRKARDAEKDRINSQLADALGMLRNRPDRIVSVAAAASCAGATGRELSGPDAEFLVRIAAEGDRLRAEVAELRAWVDAVTGGHK